MLLLGKALDSSFYAVAVADSVQCYSNRFAWWLALATKYSCCTQVERRTEHFTLAPWALHGNAVKTQHAQLRNPLDKVCCYKTLYYSLTADWLSTRPTRTNKMHFWRTRNEVPVYFLLTVQHICVKVIAAVCFTVFLCYLLRFLCTPVKGKHTYSTASSAVSNYVVSCKGSQMYNRSQDHVILQSFVRVRLQVLQ